MSVYLQEKFDIGEDDPSLLGKLMSTVAGHKCCNFKKLSNP